MKISEYTSRKIARISIVCAILVVFLHSYSKTLSASMSGSLTWWIQDFVSQGVARVAVPFFFVVSGFLMFRNFSENDIFTWYIRSLKSRMRSLCVPYFAWSLIGLASMYVMTRFADTQIHVYDWANLSWWLSVFGLTTPPKFMFHLWFVKAILIFMIFAPLTAIVVFRHPRATLLSLLLVSTIRFEFLGDWPFNLMFFVIGIWIAGKSSDQIHQVLKLFKSGVWYLIAWLSLVCLKVFATRLGLVDIYGLIRCSDLLAINVMVPINLLGVAALWAGGDKLTVCERFAPFAFFLYCSHWIILLWSGAILKRVLPFNGELMVWVVPPALTVVLAIVLGSVMCKRLHSVYKVLSGGR